MNFVLFQVAENVFGTRGSFSELRCPTNAESIQVRSVAPKQLAATVKDGFAKNIDKIISFAKLTD